MNFVPPPLITPPALPAASPAPSPSPMAMGVSARWLQQNLPELARRIVANIDRPVQIAADMGLSDDQWLVLEHSAVYKKAIADATTEANSAAGLADRVRLKALMALDNGGILDMVDIMSNPETAPGVRKGAFDSLADVAGITKHKDQQASQAGTGPLIVIQTHGNSVAIGNGRVIDHD